MLTVGNLDCDPNTLTFLDFSSFFVRINEFLKKFDCLGNTQSETLREKVEFKIYNSRKEQS